MAAARVDTVDRADWAGWALRLLVAAGLVIDAVVHLRLAHGYQLAQPGGIGEGNLFRIEAAVAVLSALFVLVAGSRIAFANAALVGLGGVLVVLLYRYVEIPAFGPIPSMYEPVWFFSKTLSAVAEAAAGVLALVGVAHVSRPRRSRSAVEEHV